MGKGEGGAFLLSHLYNHTMCTAVREAGPAGGQGQVLGSTLPRAQNRAAKGSSLSMTPSNPAFFISYTAAKQKLWTVL